MKTGAALGWLGSAAATIASVTVVLLSLSFAPVPTAGTQESQEAKPDHIVEARFDLDGDGKEDAFRLEVRRQRDFSYNSVTGETSSEKFLWFRSVLEIRSGADQHPLLKDEWSIKESDMGSFQLRLGDLTPRQYFDQYFSGLTSENPTFSTTFFETGRLEVADINPEALKYSLRLADIPEEQWEEIQEEIIGYPEARLFQYRGNWAEDLRWVVYVKSLNRGIHYYFGYPE